MAPLYTNIIITTKYISDSSAWRHIWIESFKVVESIVYLLRKKPFEYYEPWTASLPLLLVIFYHDVVSFVFYLFMPCVYARYKNIDIYLERERVNWLLKWYKKKIYEISSQVFVRTLNEISIYRWYKLWYVREICRDADYNSCQYRFLHFS